MLIEGQFPVAAAPQELLQHLFDVRLMASCLPGCESIEPIDDNRYRAVIVMAMAGIKARFDLQVEITKRDEHNVWAIIRGEEGGRASTLQADSQITLSEAGDGTLVSYKSEVALTGRLGRFALGMMKKQAQNVGNEFAANLCKTLEELGGVAPGAAAGAPLPGPSESSQTELPRPWWKAVWSWLLVQLNIGKKP